MKDLAAFTLNKMHRLDRIILATYFEISTLAIPNAVLQLSKLCEGLFPIFCFTILLLQFCIYTFFYRKVRSFICLATK
jgi:hypothetical protein